MSWWEAVRAALPGGYRFYGDGGTIHGSTRLDVETHHGHVVAVWFRCSTVPFHQVEVDAHRANEMRRLPGPALVGIVFDDGDVPESRPGFPAVLVPNPRPHQPPPPPRRAREPSGWRAALGRLRGVTQRP